jgi:hypothetical protein
MRQSSGFACRLLCCFVLSLLFVTASGCGQKTGTVSGKVTYQGKALPGGNVNFLSEGQGAVFKTSKIESDGSYSVSGIPVGPAKITVQGVSTRRMATVPGQEKGGAPNSDQKEVIVPPQYSNAEQSPLKYDVKPGSQTHPIDLK